MIERMVVTCKLYGEEVDKLRALKEFSSLNDLEDVAGICLEQGIIVMWEAYRNNPKHAHQIKEWEAKRVETQ